MRRREESGIRRKLRTVLRLPSWEGVVEVHRWIKRSGVGFVDVFRHVGTAVDRNDTRRRETELPDADAKLRWESSERVLSWRVSHWETASREHVAV